MGGVQDSPSGLPGLDGAAGWGEWTSPMEILMIEPESVLSVDGDALLLLAGGCDYRWRGANIARVSWQMLG